MKKIKNTSYNPFDILLGVMGGNNQSDAIERQEAEGQDDLVNSDQLPAKLNSYGTDNDPKEQYKKMGIKVIGQTEGDDLFLDVILPDGWRKEATDHSMWSKLVDHKGRTRASIFYKASFYDRDSFINFEKRYYSSSDFNDNTIVHFVYDAGTKERLFETEPIEQKYYEVEGGRERNEKLLQQCDKFLNKNFRKHNDFNAYWD